MRPLDSIGARGGGFTLWLTGMSGAGKSTLAARIASELRTRRFPVELLDGDEVRENLSRGLGFSREDRDTNVRRIGYVARLLSRNGVVALVAAISPYRDTRLEVRQQHRAGNFIEVHVDCPLATLIDRDVKGLYRKALSGEIAHFTGVSDPYEAPRNAEIVVRSAEEGVEESVGRILDYLEDYGWIEKTSETPILAGGVLTASSAADGIESRA